MWGQPVVFQMGISHFGHLFVKNKKYMKPIIVFSSKVFDCVRTASHFGHFSSVLIPHLHFYNVKTKSQLQEGHFSISVVKEVYFLNNLSSKSSSSSFLRLERAMQTSIGSFPSKGDIIQLPALQLICDVTVLICWCQQLQQMPEGRRQSIFQTMLLVQQIQHDYERVFSFSYCENMILKQIMGLVYAINHRYNFNFFEYRNCNDRQTPRSPKGITSITKMAGLSGKQAS